MGDWRSRVLSDEPSEYYAFVASFFSDDLRAQRRIYGKSYLTSWEAWRILASFRRCWLWENVELIVSFSDSNLSDKDDDRVSIKTSLQLGRISQNLYWCAGDRQVFV